MVQKQLIDNVGAAGLVIGVEQIGYIKIEKDCKKCLTEKKISSIIDNERGDKHENSARNE